VSVPYSFLAATVETVHALAMCTWILGCPLLFVSRWPRLRRTYAIYAITFAVLSRGSAMVLGACFLTDLSGWLWTRAGWPERANEWFSVRFAHEVFGFAPSHHGVSLASEVLVTITAIGVLTTLRAGRARPALAVITDPSTDRAPVR
jgi:hypothetical protein